MGQLYLVGTSHFDLKGSKRLEKLIDFLKPEYIMCEGNTQPEYSFNLHEFNSNNILSNRDNLIKNFGEAGFQKLYEFIHTTGYEQWVPFQYSKSHPNVQVCSIRDDKVESQKPIVIKNSDFSKLLDDNAEIIQSVLSTTVEEYQNAMESNYFECHTDVPEANIIDKIRELDKRYAQKSRLLYNSNEGNGLVIMGVGHIFGNYENLASRLMDLLPNRLKLIEADYL